MSADVRLRAAILGCGRIAGAFAAQGTTPTTHAQALCPAGRMPFRLVAVSDSDGARAKAFAARWEVDNTCAPEELGAGGLDLVTVATPDRLHARNLTDLLAGRRPPRLVIMEKPLCASPDELSVLEAACAEHPETMVVVNHARRFDPGHRAARDAIGTRRLGRVVGVRWVYYGGWLHNGVHVIDTLRMLLGGEIEPISVRPGCEDRVGDPCLEGEFRCDAWPTASISIESHPETAFQLFEGEVRMEEGRLRLNDFGNEIVVDTVRVNAIGERELKGARPIVDERRATAMQVLYDLAARFLMQGDNEIVTCCGLAQAVATMRTLFDAKARLGQG